MARTILPTKEEIAYAAGLFDAEGSITIGRARIRSLYNPRFNLYIRFSNQSRRLLRRVGKIFDGGWFTIANLQHPCVNLGYGSWRAHDVLEAMYPYLIIKANPAWIALCFSERLHRLGKTGVRASAFEIEIREAAKEIIMKMNDRVGGGLSANLPKNLVEKSYG